MKVVFGISFGLLLFLFVAGVSAEIFIDGFEDGRYNLGDSISLGGYVQKQSIFTGTLEISSVCENESKIVFFSLLTLGAGEKYNFLQEFPVGNVTGSCYYNLVAKSDDGGVEEKKGSEYIVSRELRIDADTDVLTQKPGDEVFVSGVVRKANGLRVNGGSVALTLDGKVFGVGLSNGAFSYRFVLPDDIDSGNHKIEIQARDLNGNEGFGGANFKVISVPEALVISLDKDSYKPRDRIVARVSLNDQSGKNIIGSSTVQLVDPNGDAELTRVVDNGNDFEIFLNELTLPGTWILRAENKDFKASKKFFVEEIKDKEIKLEGSELIIRNIGNVDYDDPIQIDLQGEDGEEFRVIKKTSLKPNQTIVVDLNDEAPEGSYDVKVGGNLITGGVVLSGSDFANLKGNAVAGYVALVFVFLFLIFVVVTKGRKRLSRRRIAREKGRDILIRRKERKEDKDLMKAKKEDINYFVEKVKKEVPIDSAKEKEPEERHPFDIFN